MAATTGLGRVPFLSTGSKAESPLDKFSGYERNCDRSFLTSAALE
jgi:hypothetical protein